MKKLLLTSVAGVALMAGAPANAADLGTRPTYKAPPMVAPVPLFTWTGCYIGAHIGGGWGRKDFSDFNANGDLEGPVHDNVSGFVGGGQIGCNYQFAPNWVVGIEGDLSGADIKGDVIDPFTTGKTLRVKTDWLASATGRLGYAWDRWLLYVKGGAAWAHDKYDDIAGVGPADLQGSETRSGWTVGAGVEWAFWNNWSAKLEYDYYDLGSRNLRFSGLSVGVPVFVDERVDQKIQAVKFGINYRFGWGKAPVVAKY